MQTKNLDEAIVDGAELYCPRAISVAAAGKVVDFGIVVAPAGQEARDEFPTLLPCQRQCNSVADLSELVQSPIPDIIRRAERFMIDNAAEPITVIDVAAYLGVGVRTLQAGFRAWRSTTPTTFLRGVRLCRVRWELENPKRDTSVTAAAMQNGFFHLGRFSRYYHDAFGETPRDTLRRTRERSPMKTILRRSGGAHASDA